MIVYLKLKTTAKWLEIEQDEHIQNKCSQIKLSFISAITN